MGLYYNKILRRTHGSNLISCIQDTRRPKFLSKCLLSLVKRLVIDNKDNNKITEHRIPSNLPKGKSKLINQQTEKISQQPENWVRVGILVPCRKHFHDRIISLRREAWDNKTSLAPPLFVIKMRAVPVTYILWMFYWILELLRQCGIFFSCFPLYSYK